MIELGAVHMVTRRTTQRMFFLLPRKAVNQAFRYCLALAMLQSGVLVHAYCVMSNHYHIICSDPRGLLPKFTEVLNVGWLVPTALRRRAHDPACADVHHRWLDALGNSVEQALQAARLAPQVVEILVLSVPGVEGCTLQGQCEDDHACH